MEKLEARMPVEIRAYEAEWFKGLTRRQCIAGVIVIAIFVGVFAFSRFVIEIPIPLRIMLTLILAAPAGIVGFLKYRGMYAEEYLPIISRFFREPKEYGKWSVPDKETIAAVKENQKGWMK
ncbi:PrgI family protein [Ruminococcaceae bacterium YRB3002]|nr:PrgI family protein [Ruminococcaceae bacterium YRB3002]